MKLRASGFGRWIVGLGAAWLFAFYGATELTYAVYAAVRGSLGHVPFWDLIRDFPFEWQFLFDLGVGAGTAAAVLAFLVRLVATGRYHALGVDMLERPRRWVNAHPKLLLGLGAVFPLGVLWLLFVAFRPGDLGPANLAMRALVASLTSLPPVLGIAFATRAMARTLVAPLAPSEKKPDADGASAAEGFFFRAVAVTPETRAAALTVVTLSVLAVAAMMSSFENPEWAAALLALAVGGTAAFYRASKIALGIDGVLITGTSRTRFFAYADLDQVTLSRGGEVVLERAGRAVLRLQLHGDDAPKRDAIVERIRAGVARARDVASGGANRLAEGNAQAIEQAALGKGGYRAAAATRDELWELVESVATAAGPRVAAARALASSADGEERARLRVAAEHCAEPAARAALLEIAEAEAAAEEEAELAAVVPRGPAAPSFR